MGLFDLFKKKKQPKEPISMEDYIRERKKEGGTDEEIKDEIMSSISIETSYDSDVEPMKNLPTPKGNYTEDNIEELWDNSSLIEDDKEKGDLDGVEFWRDLEKKGKENYYYGKKVFREEEWLI